MKEIIVFLLGFFSVEYSFAQSIAVDFTATDCSGNSHNLYTELATGKVVVLAWVMPCEACVKGAKKADSSTSILNLSYNNKIALWIVDDGMPSDCNYLSGWINTNNFNPSAVFGNASNEIDENNYGGNGMPHVVVIGPNKQIYFNRKNKAAEGGDIFDSITAALGIATSISNAPLSNVLSIFPNPGWNEIKISSGVAIKLVSILSTAGLIAKDIYYEHSVLSTTVTVENLIPSLYLVKVVDINGQTAIKKLYIQR